MSWPNPNLFLKLLQRTFGVFFAKPYILYTYCTYIYIHIHTYIHTYIHT